MTKSPRTLSISIHRPPAVVEAFITDPRNLPSWAAGLGTSVRCEDGQWFVATLQGEVRIRFVEPNPFGVVDHWVRIAPDVEIHMPMRVLPNGPGSEVLITVFPPATMTAEQFAADLELIRADLQSLKRVLEGTVA